mgnify:CR=1 FL=1
MLLTKQKNPFYVNMAKSVGRPATAKVTKESNKDPGPATYNTEKYYDRLSKSRSTINIGFSGYGKQANLGVIPTKDKLKIKSERFLD